MSGFEPIQAALNGTSAWIESHAGLASWVQAVGTLIAIWATASISRRGIVVQERAAAARAEEARRMAIKAVEDKAFELAYISGRTAKFSDGLLKEKTPFILSEIRTLRLSIVAIVVPDIAWIDRRKALCLMRINFIVEYLEAVLHGISLEESDAPDETGKIPPMRQLEISSDGIEQATQQTLSRCDDDLGEVANWLQRIRTEIKQPEDVEYEKQLSAQK